MIKTRDLTKVFRTTRRREGLRGAVRALVSRDYTTVTAVDHVSFEIQAGEMVGYVGPNGAGKSTTLKMLTGILVPTDGEVLVDGVIPYQNRIANARQIGVVFGQRTQLWWDIPVIESFRLLREIYEVPASTYRENLACFGETLGLDELLPVPVRQLSLGQRMRCDLAAALLHNPRIIYLDEPTIGLDVAVKERIRGFIKTINRERGVTVLLTTHDLRDIEELCPRIMIIDHGRIIYDGSLAEIKTRYGKYRVLVCDVKEPLMPQEALSQPFAQEGVEIVRQGEHRLWVRFPAEAVSAAAVIAQVMKCYTVLDLTIEEPSIEAVIKEIYNHGMV